MAFPTSALAAALTVVATGALTAPAASAAERPEPRTHSLLQLNLCLSGLAGCYPRTAYPTVLDEAAAVIERNSPDAVTVNEGCSGDAATLAERTGYHVAFTTVIYRGAPLPCVKPTGRGVFGNAVLTKAPIRTTEEAPYAAQNGVEERRWLCATTTDDATTCTSHLTASGPELDPTRQAQCDELGAQLRHEARRGREVWFAGDVNRRTTCAPDGYWHRDDDAATQAVGIQHVYGTQSRLKGAVSQVIPMTYTDHDALLVTAATRP
ncbi:endonuclease/exonuclease/phosphatase family protein [Luteipulveratus halotolerans]|uniref:endonuclease/exonuclease/phosphatase family protein n=1 Tax=Luteipulveratus halotolerans TaxID=1631356 RepID=UPI0006814C40|nr:endonuclease/exonuclease/phosphatase family protein [Luteipulveratus halotolerans]